MCICLFIRMCNPYTFDLIFLNYLNTFIHIFTLSHQNYPRIRLSAIDLSIQRLVVRHCFLAIWPPFGHGTYIVILLNVNGINWCIIKFIQFYSISDIRVLNLQYIKNSLLYNRIH